MRLTGMQEPTHEVVAQLCLRHQEVASTGSAASKTTVSLPSDAWPYLYLEVRLTVTADEGVVSDVILQAVIPLRHPAEKSGPFCMETIGEHAIQPP